VTTTRKNGRFFEPARLSRIANMNPLNSSCQLYFNIPFNAARFGRFLPNPAIPPTALSIFFI